ncbi:MAG TPA: biotin/lipoyl-binding protein [Sphingomonas sp.]|nr:biotin/lipoyl-binding protein [Sphingomonas sp.]
MKHIIAPLARWAVTLLIVFLAVLVAIWLWRRYETDPWTRDGHVRVDVVRVAPDVGGLITSVEVRDNQRVQKGQLLFVVDMPRFADALGQADASIASTRATLEQARRVAKRDLALGDLVAKETHEQNVAQVATAEASLNAAIAARQTAALDVHRTAIRASVNGIVTNLDLHPGDYVAAGSQALALVDIDSLRVEGYFEETKLRHIHVGDKAKIRLMGDERELEGHVDSIAAGIADDQSSDTANQLRQVQPTFSWVRLAQRIPVRVHVDRMPVGTQLIAGRTATVTILPESGPSHSQPQAPRPTGNAQAPRP